ncbi:unnamed protein product [Sphagnum troendelagicum]
MFPSIHHLCRKQSHEKKRWSNLDYWNCKWDLNHEPAKKMKTNQHNSLNANVTGSNDDSISYYFNNHFNSFLCQEVPHCCAIQSLKDHFQRGPKVSQSQQVSA